MVTNYPFKIYYVVLNANDIINYCGPTRSYIDHLNKKNKFYKKLEKSILDCGFRNPILVTAGRAGIPNIRIDKLPENIDIDDSLICDRHGGSRLWVGQKHNMDIPCIVSDFVGRFFDHENELKNTLDIKNCFTDKPEIIRINAHGVHIKSAPHYHMIE
ncbi:MAG: hypothetical protein WC284_04375 [Candidimonas sp.]